MVVNRKSHPNGNKLTNRKEEVVDLAPVVLTAGQSKLLLMLMSADIDVLSPGRQLRGVASGTPSGESQTMLPPTPQEGGGKACQAIPAVIAPARSRRAKGPTVKRPDYWKREVAHWLVRNDQTGLVSDRLTGASWDHARQVLWCTCGAQTACLAPDDWQRGEVLACRECGERWMIVGDRLENKEA